MKLKAMEVKVTVDSPEEVVALISTQLVPKDGMQRAVMFEFSRYRPDIMNTALVYLQMQSMEIVDLKPFSPIGGGGIMVWSSLTNNPLYVPNR